jgi:hypothetical protein
MIIGTLLIGVAIGALVVAPLVARHHFKRMADLRTSRGFAQRLEEIIQPDESQVDALRAVLVEHGEAFDEMASRHRDEINDLIDSLHVGLDTILTDEQIERLEQRRRRMRPPGGPPGDPHGKPKPVRPE